MQKKLWIQAAIGTGTIVIFSLVLFADVSSVNALSFAAPTIFKLQTVNVVSPDGLQVEKTNNSHNFVVGPIEKQFFHVSDTGASESPSPTGYIPQKERPATSLKLTTKSSSIQLCLYHFSEQRCGNNVEGTRDYADSSFGIVFSDGLAKTERVLLDVLAKQIDEDQAKERLDALGLSEYEGYLALLKTIPPQEIEHYSVAVDVDGKHFTIEGILTYEPNGIAPHPEVVAKSVDEWDKMNDAMSATALIIKILGIMIALALAFFFFKKLPQRVRNEK